MKTLKTNLDYYVNRCNPVKIALCNKIKKILLVIFISMWGITVLANPVLDNVHSGSITIQNSNNGNTTTINQATQKGIINWTSFNVDSNQAVHFQQPVGGITLNRINAQNGASQIYGTITATGQIILINAAGIYFGPNAYVNVGGLIATTAALSNADFNNSHYNFTNAGPGSIINAGTIIAKKTGLVALLGSNVTNSGLIKAHLGSIVLATGSAFTMSFDGGMVNFAVKVPANSGGVVNNSGRLIADGGQIIVTARTASHTLDNVINMTGIAQANSVRQKNGVIIFDSGSGTLNITGKVIATGKHKHQTGGVVKALGSNVIINDNALIDVSGNDGGGKIFIGGNSLGIGPLPNSSYTAVGRATLLADALRNGNGGDVIVWSDLGTYFAGNISSKGGALSGNGGFIEVSGGQLNFNGTVDTSAPHGKTGTFLLDPTNIFLINGSLLSGALDLSIISNLLSFLTGDSGSNTLSLGALLALGNVNIILQAKNAITVGTSGGASATINLTTLLTNTLTLQAGDTTTVGGGSIIFNPGSSISTGGGNVNIIAGDSTIQKTGNAILGLINAGGGNVTVNAQQGITLNGQITGRVITLVGKTFTNNSGSTALNPSTNFVIWTTSPLTNSNGGLLSNFIQYNAVFGSSSVLGTGNGYLYTLAPVITASLTGSVSKVYNTTTAATLSAGNYATSGVVGSDVVTLNNPVSGLFADANVGTGKTISISGLGISSVTNGSATVYGYQLASTALNAAIGVITPATLTVGLNSGSPVSKVYDATTAATLGSGNFSLGGILGSDVVVVNPVLGAFSTADVGTNKLISVTGLTLGGSGAGNYILNTTATTGNTGIITPATVTVTVTGSITKVYDTTTTAPVIGSNLLLGGVLGSDLLALANVYTGQYDTPNVGTNKGVTVVGLTLAGAAASNYVLANASVSANIGTITPATLTVSGVLANNKVYNTNTAATLNLSGAALSGVLGSDTVTTSSTGYTANFASANVGNNIGVSVSNLSLTGSSSGNYVLTQPTGLTANITPATLTLSGASANTKVYDTTTAATLSLGSATLNGVLGSDSVTLNSGSYTANFSTANAGNNLGVTVANLGLSGTNAGNYTITQPTGLTANITPATLTLSGASANNKVYDTTTAATLNLGSAALNGILGSDSVTLDSGSYTANFSTANAGSGLGVTVTNLGLSGTNAGNYTITQPTGLTANITPATLTLSGVSANTKVYDTTTAATLNLSSAALNGVLGSDSVTLDSGSYTANFSTANAGSNLNVTVANLGLSGVSAGNYAITQPTGLTANITPATLTVDLNSGEPISKIYDTGIVATVGSGNFSLNGILGSDVVVVNPVTGSYTDANVGTNKLITVSGLTLGGSEAGNYILDVTSASGSTGIITPATISVSLTGSVSKTYDTTTAAPVIGSNFSLSGVLGSDVVTIANISTGQYDDANAGINKNVSVTGLSLSGAAAGNYVLASTSVNANIGTITPASLTLSGISANTKIYDTTTAATLNLGGATLNGVLGGDSVTLNSGSYTANFSTANAGNNLGITVANLGLSGTAAGNYAITQPAGLTANITPATLTLSGVSANNKIYDSTTSATLNLSGATLNGVLGGDSVTLNPGSYTASFSTANAGNNLGITVINLGLSGTAAGNYAITQPSGLTASIAPLALTLSGVSANTKVYDTTTVATLNLGTATLNGVLGSDSVTLNPGSYTANFSTANAGSNLGVTVSNLGLSGTGAGNYSITQPTGLTANITPATLTVSNITANNKTYNANTSTSLNLSNAILSGVLGSDNVSVNTTGYIASFANVNAGSNLGVTVINLGLSGSSAGNYALTQPAGLSANISPASVTASLNLSPATLQNAADGSSLSLRSGNFNLSGVLGNDNVFINPISATVNNGSTTNEKIINVSGLTLSGANAGNYSLANSSITVTENFNLNIPANTINSTPPTTTVPSNSANPNVSAIITGGGMINAQATSQNNTNQNILDVGNNNQNATLPVVRANDGSLLIGKQESGAINKAINIRNILFDEAQLNLQLNTIKDALLLSYLFDNIFANKALYKMNNIFKQGDWSVYKNSVALYDHAQIGTNYKAFLLVLLIVALFVSQSYKINSPVIYTSDNYLLPQKKSILVNSDDNQSILYTNFDVDYRVSYRNPDLFEIDVLHNTYITNSVLISSEKWRGDKIRMEDGSYFYLYTCQYAIKNQSKKISKKLDAVT